MWIYGIVCRFASPTTARVVTGLWYGLLLALVLLCILEPQADFRYGKI